MNFKMMMILGLWAGVFSHGVAAGPPPASWPEPRHDSHLTGFQPGQARLDDLRVVAQFDLGRVRGGMTPIALDDGTSVGLALAGGEISCWGEDGTARWRLHPQGLNFSAILAIEDLDRDGNREILLSAGRPAEPYGAAALVSLGKGELLWRYDVEPMSYSWFARTGQWIPGAGGSQIIVIMHGYPPDKKNGYIALFDFPDKGKAPRQRWRYDFDQYTCFPTLLTTDLDGDSVKELAVETHSHMWLLDALTGSVRQFAQWDPAPANVRSYGFTEFRDLNGDGREDFLCIANFSQHHEVLLNKNGRMEKAWHHGWPESVTTGKVATVWAEPPVADVNGDGKLEVVLSMFNSEGDPTWMLRVYDAVTGELKMRAPGLIAAATADADGDGDAEILANASGDPTQEKLDGARLLAHEAGGLSEIWHDDSVEAVRGAGELRVRRGTELLSLKMNAGKVELAAIPAAAAPVGRMPDFSRVEPWVGSSSPLLLAEDMDGDNACELITHENSRVRILKYDFLAKANLLAPVAEYESSAPPAIGDFNGDGVMDLALCHVSPDSQPVVEVVTPAQDGKLVWKIEYPAPGREGLPQPRVAYLRTIHLTGRRTPDLYLWAGTPVVRSMGIEGATGTLLWEKGEIPKSERYWGPSVNEASAYDFNEDGFKDLVFTNPDYYCVVDGPTGDFLLGPLFPPDIFKQPSQGLYTLPALLDAREGPPDVCLVAGHYFQGGMSLRAKPYWHKLPEPGENRCAPEAFAQGFEGDPGAWSMGYGRQDGRFACVNARDGSARWELDLQSAVFGVTACNKDWLNQRLFGPIFLVGTSHGGLLALGESADGAPDLVPLWKTNAPVSTPITADFDGDGFVEIACVTGDGWVNILRGERDDAADTLVYEGGTGPGAGKHIVFLAGDEEYRSEESLVQMARILAFHHGFKCTVLFSLDAKDGTINPNASDNLTGAEALDHADAIFMMLRFRQWPDATMKHFVDACLRGVPIIALRTSTHAFQYPKNADSLYARYSHNSREWEGGFGRQVLGETWVSHLGTNHKEATLGIIEPAAKDDPILRGVRTIFARTGAYTTNPQPDSTILMRAQVLAGTTPDAPPESTGKNDPLQPLAWRRLHTNEAGTTNRVFCTTMGSSTDLLDESLRRMLVNSVYWGFGMDVPAEADVRLVGDYQPTEYGFNTFKRGVRPDDFSLPADAGRVSR